MPSASAIKAGETFVRMSLEAGEMEKELAKIRNKLDKFARSAVKVGATLAAIGGAGVVALSKAAAAANRVELVGRRLDAVFRDAADEARNFARELAVSIGDSRFAVEDTLVTFKSFFAEIVNSEQDQIAFSQRMTELSRDFAAFQGMDTTEALQRFISALSGSPEVLDRFGINLKAAALDAEFAAKGLDMTTESAAEFQKVIARMDIIERTMSKQGAIGKAVTELATFSGALRAATSAVRDFTVAVGQALLPILRPVIATFANMARGFETIATHAPALTVAFGVIAVGTLAAGVALVGAAAAATALGLAIAVVSATATAYSGWAKLVKMETASVSAQIAFAKSQLHGLAIMAAQTGLRWAGFDSSLKKSISTLATVRTALIGTLATMGKLALITVLLSTALGTVPAIGSETAIAIVAITAAIGPLILAYKKLATAISLSTAALATQGKVSKGVAAANNILALSTTALGVKMIAGRAAAVAMTVALRGLAIAAAVVSFILSPVGLLIAGVAAVLGAAVIGASQVAREMGRFGTASQINARKSAKEIGLLGKMWGSYVDNFKEGASVIADGWKSIFGGETSAEKKMREASDAAKQQRADAASAADDLIELDRKVQEARIQGMKDRNDRERALLKLKHDRELSEAEKQDNKLVKMAERHWNEMDDLKNGETPASESAIRRLEERQRQERDTAIANSAIVQKTIDRQRVESENLAREMADRRWRMELSYATRMARAKIALQKQGAEQELALLKVRQSQEMALAKRNGEDILALDKIQATERAAIYEALNRSIAENAMDLEREIAEFRIQGIEDDEEREIAAVKAEFKEKKKALDAEAEAAAKLAKESGGEAKSRAGEFFRRDMELQEFLEERLARIRSKFSKQRREESEEEAEARRDELQSLQDEIDKLQIDLKTPEGLQRTLAQLELQRKQALRDAVGDEGQIRKINQLFRLRAQAAKQGAEAAQSRIAGATDIRQILAFRGGKAQPKAEQLQEEGNRLLKKSVDTLNELLLIFGVTA